jgi:NO-binding membrane sensor protein with MHYT domain
MKLMKSSSYVLMSALFRSLHRLVIGGVITALGALACHFIGMASVVNDGLIEWNDGEVYLNRLGVLQQFLYVCT